LNLQQNKINYTQPGSCRLSLPGERKPVKIASGRAEGGNKNTPGAKWSNAERWSDGGWRAEEHRESPPIKLFELPLWAANEFFNLISVFCWRRRFPLQKWFFFHPLSLQANPLGKRWAIQQTLEWGK
jgi:hypothetical protein